MNMNEGGGLSQPPKKNAETPASELSVGSKVIRSGEIRTIESYRQTASGIEITFDDKDVAMLDSDDTLEVPAS